MPKLPQECAVCGAFGPWRRAGHAEWCDDIKAFLRSPRARVRPAPAAHGTVERYLDGCSCLLCVHAWVDHHRLAVAEADLDVLGDSAVR